MGETDRTGSRPRVLVLNGPNLNLLGEREPAIYGTETLDSIEGRLERLADELGVEVVCEQHNGEGELVDRLHDARSWAVGVLFNPGAYTHYSYALGDAVAAIGIPVYEVHISNIYAREEYRRHSVIAPVVVGTVAGCGALGYELALRALVETRADWAAAGPSA